jgi:hypothetical protein
LFAASSGLEGQAIEAWKLVTGDPHALKRRGYTIARTSPIIRPDYLN